MRIYQYPQFIKGYGVIGLILPEWFTKKHAKLIYNDKQLHDALQNRAKMFCEMFPQYITDWETRRTKRVEYSVNLLWCECCGLHHVEVRPGDATSLGIDFHEWDEGSSRNKISDHNIDSMHHLIILYQVWAQYLNWLELKKEEWDKQKVSE